MALTSEQVLGLVTKIEHAPDADKRLVAIQVLEATLDGASEIPDVDSVIMILKVSVKNANQAVAAAALAFLPSLFVSLAAPAVTHGRASPSTVAHVRAAINHLMPVLIEKLGDQKERVREASRKALTQLGLSAYQVSPASDAAAGARKGKELETPLQMYERLMRENALGAKAARIKEQATQVLPALKLATQDHFPVRLMLPSLVSLLADADPSVREGSKAALIALFVNATPAAKAGLKKELERQDVRKPTMDAIIKEVLAGPSAIPQPVASTATSAGIGPVPTMSAQVAVTHAASGGGILAASALGATEDDVPAVYIASRGDLDRTFNQMLPFFEGKETEQNWLSREQSIIKIRGLLKTNVHVTYRAAFLDGIKHVNEGILKTLVSLRTTLAVHACSLLSELARAVGDGLDQLAETFLNALLRMAGMTKKIVAASTQAAAREFFIHVPFKHNFAIFLSQTMQEKTTASRQAAIEHICTLLQYQGSTKRHALESHGSLNALLQALKRALSDQNKDVRAKAREAFWVFHAIWPAQATAILEAADAATKKAILASVPAPGTVLLLNPDKSGGAGAVAQTATPAVAAAAHQQLAASAPAKKPAFSQTVGPGLSDFTGGIAPKLRPVASVSSVASSVASSASAPVSNTSISTATAASSGPAKRRAVGPSAALLAAKREAKLKMLAAEREQEQEQGGGKASMASSQDDGDSDGGDNWMADFKPSSVVKPASASSRSAFTPARAKSPPSASASISSLPPPPTSPPRFVPKYGHDAILASPPKKISHVRSFSHKSFDEINPSRIPLPNSPTASPRMSDSPRMRLSSPRMGTLGSLSHDSSRLPRPSIDLLALANDEDADATQLLAMAGPDVSQDLMVFSSSSPSGTPVAKKTTAAISTASTPAPKEAETSQQAEEDEDVSEVTVAESKAAVEDPEFGTIEDAEKASGAEVAPLPVETSLEDAVAALSVAEPPSAPATTDSTRPESNGRITSPAVGGIAASRAGTPAQPSAGSRAGTPAAASSSPSGTPTTAGQKGRGPAPATRSAVASPTLSPKVGPATVAAAATRAPLDARPLQPGAQSAAVSSFLRRASRLEQGSPIKSKPEAAQWVAAIREGTADLRTYKRLLKLTIDFRINGPAADTQLVPGRGGSRSGSPAAGALGLERMGDADYEDEEAGMRAWEEGNLFDDLFVAICGSLQAPAKIEELRTACFALLHRLVENQYPLFTTTGRELDLLALLFQLRKEGRKGKQTLDASEAILTSWSVRTDPMLGLGAVINNLKATADEIGSGSANGNGTSNGGEAAPGASESTVRTLVMGLKVLGRLLLRLPGEVIEDELSRATDVLRMTLTHVNVELRRTAIETLVAANKQINHAETLFKLVGPLPTSQQDLLMYYFHKAGQQ